MAGGRVDQPNLRRETQESKERLLANERLKQQIEDELRMLNEERKTREKRQEAEYQKQRQREIEEEQARRREEELKRLHLQIELCKCRSERGR